MKLHTPSAVFFVSGPRLQLFDSHRGDLYLDEHGRTATPQQYTPLGAFFIVLLREFIANLPKYNKIQNGCLKEPDLVGAAWRPPKVVFWDSFGCF